MEKLIFISRHEPNNGQKAIAREMGFDKIEKIEIVFGENPVEQIESLRVKKQTTLALVAPAFVTLSLLRAGYKLLEFVNMPSARHRGVFICKGAYLHTLTESKYFSCPLSVEEQEESAL